ncbi:UNVERIFIED_CONTAM: Pyridoxal phosphate homeostasis protein [Sesamum calycinum]|uniref:Pyridoxal phosphate homeostasis protein n=1 Tax=Sesamum calycinum TaxID=2727403 RepID=A0AAW2Q506_9LAMI
MTGDRSSSFDAPVSPPTSHYVPTATVSPAIRFAWRMESPITTDKSSPLRGLPRIPLSIGKFTARGHRLFRQLPEDIEWHFIGHLQSNKVKPLLTAVPNIAMVEGVDNEKVANNLDRVVSNIGRQPLKVLVQVNTSGEVSKSGINPSECVDLVKHVKLGCPNLEFAGLMTIGMPDYTSTPENFKTLLNCRAEICKALGMAESQCELSMGMSGDFEQAIEMGSTNVRIGSTIFGPRDYSKKK